MAGLADYAGNRDLMAQILANRSGAGIPGYGPGQGPTDADLAALMGPDMRRNPYGFDAGGGGLGQGPNTIGTDITSPPLSNPDLQNAPALPSVNPDAQPGGKGTTPPAPEGPQVYSQTQVTPQEQEIVDIENATIANAPSAKSGQIGPEAVPYSTMGGQPSYTTLGAELNAGTVPGQGPPGPGWTGTVPSYTGPEAVPGNPQGQAPNATAMPGYQGALLADPEALSAYAGAPSYGYGAPGFGGITGYGYGQGPQGTQPGYEAYAGTNAPGVGGQPGAFGDFSDYGFDSPADQTAWGEAYADAVAAGLSDAEAAAAADDAVGGADGGYGGDGGDEE